MNLDFFNSSTYYVRVQGVKLKSNNVYKLYNEEFVEIGSLVEVRHYRFLKGVLPKVELPYQIKLIDINKRLLATISSDWTYKSPIIRICDAKGNKIGSIKKKISKNHTSFRLYNRTKQEVAIIEGDKKLNVFNSSEKLIGNLVSDTTSLPKESTTDKSFIKIKLLPESIHLAHKMVILTSAFAIHRIVGSNLQCS